MIMNGSRVGGAQPCRCALCSNAKCCRKYLQIAVALPLEFLVHINSFQINISAIHKLKLKIAGAQDMENAYFYLHIPFVQFMKCINFLSFLCLLLLLSFHANKSTNKMLVIFVQSKEDKAHTHIRHGIHLI